MKFKYLISYILFLSSISTCFAQYTSWIVGSPADVTTSATGGILLMGGSTDNDDAMRWMLSKAAGGDIVVIRATGTDGYNSYLFGLATVNSVETILINSRSIANLTEVAQKIRNAEALFIAGGDQANYVNFWEGTLVEDAINYLITQKKVVVGGTSAGCAIQGRTYFDARVGTITTAEALANPYNSKLTLQRDNFLNHSILANTVTDTHYDNPDRRGRHVTFLARMVKDWNVNARGIGVNERTAVCVESNGTARVFGDPAQNNFVYFLQSFGGAPETCVAGSPLTWNRSGNAVKVYKIKGDKAGTNTFNLNTWTSGSGGIWENFYVTNGTLQITSPATAPGTDPPAGCAVPTGLSASSVTSTSATLSWNATTATTYSLRYRVNGTTTWTTVSVSATSRNITGLQASTTYEAQVRSDCSSTSLSAYSSSITFQTPQTSVSYCAANGSSTQYEWIDLVDIRNLYNQSGNNNGYALFTTPTTSLERGQSYSIYLRPAFSGTSYTEYWRVWIDFNRNGSFTDAGEQVYQGNSRNPLSGTVSIPSSVSTGTTRMRVAMRYNSYPSSCGSFSNGEVEDYTVTIVGTSGQSTDEIVVVQEPSMIDLYPNPAKDAVTIRNAEGNDAPWQVVIYNVLGKAITSRDVTKGVNEISVNTQSFNNGLYVVRIKTRTALTDRKLSIER